MRGLLEKAGNLRRTLGLADDALPEEPPVAPAAGGDDPSGPAGHDEAAPEEIAFDPASGITREEQREIRAEIERVARGSRLAVDAETLAVKAAKRGVLFPVLVNVTAVLALAIGLAVLYFLVQRGETRISREDTATITAEGKLLAAVRQESEAQLQQKNQQIDAIQGRLAEIDRQRQDLQATMDARVQSKESELRSAMDQELAAEKARLQQQGLSDQDIQKKLADLETQKNTALAGQMDAFRAQAEADRRKSEAALQQMQDQYNADLARANTERQQALADARKRETDLQAQLEAQAAAAQAQQAQTAAAQAEQAQTRQQLATLTSQKAREDLVSQQLLGLYAVAQTRISQRDYTGALTSLQAIGRFVNSADVATLPGMAQRRPVDLFIVDSLTTLVQDEMETARTDTAALAAASSGIADIRALVTDADAKLAAGRVADAERQYAQALAVLPEIARSYAFFTARSAAAETARQATVSTALARGEAARAAGNLPDAVAAYREALGSLPVAAERLDRMLSDIEAAGALTAGQKTQAEQSRAAGPLLSRADDQLAQANYPAAGAAYAQLLLDYPQSAQASQAVRGISRAIEGMGAAASTEDRSRVAQAEALSGQVTRLQQSIAQSAAEITRVKKALMDLLGLSGDPEKQDSSQLLAALSTSYGNLARAGSASATLQAQLTAAQKAAQESEQKAATLTEENRKLQEAAQAAASRRALSGDDAQRLQKYDQLLESYKKYAALEGPTSAGGGPDLRKTYGFRETFLQSASGIFEGLADRMHSYDNGFLAAGVTQGRDDTLKKASAILVQLAGQKSADERTAFFDAQLAAAQGDRGLTDYLKKLQALTPPG